MIVETTQDGGGNFGWLGRSGPGVLSLGDLARATRREARSPTGFLAQTLMLGDGTSPGICDRNDRRIVIASNAGERRGRGLTCALYNGDPAVALQVC